MSVIVVSVRARNNRNHTVRFPSLVLLFRGLRPEAGNAGSRGDLSHILLEVLELQLRREHMRPPKPSPKA